MKILYDHQVFEWQQFGGVSRYFLELYQNLPAETEREIAIKYSNNEYLKEVKGIAVSPIIDHRAEFLRGIEFPGKGRIFNWFQKRFSQRYPDAYKENAQNTLAKLNTKQYDVFHPTFYNDYFLDSIGSKPFVITIHDLTYEKYPELYKANDVLSHKMRALASRANQIIAVSEQTKRDIISNYGIDPARISVIYHGVRPSASRKPISNLPGKYILYVGAREGYKNFSYFVRAIRELLLKQDLCLVCAGSSFSEEELELFKYLDLQKRIESITVNDPELAFLYENALAFVYPSLSEGFGMPILEAFINGCPVALSSGSSFPEIAQEAAVYFDAKQGREMADVINHLVNDQELRRTMIERGYERARQFSWRMAAEKTLKVYESVI